ncbi:hypothetical protein PUN28_001768 [Cardiocondyla obscurior]|uniref:Uncharacterized protein n=1 Tax=Cardiocondyla obscurior TaxID=286306 RepID=A0AAW2GR24_9HYME
MEKYNTIMMCTNIFLELIKYTLKLISKNVQKSYVRNEHAINKFVTINEIKEHADEILKICTVVDYSKRQLLNKFYSKFKLKNKCLLKQNSTKKSIQTHEIGLNVSLPLQISLCDLETQNIPKQLQDASIITDFQEKISVATQSRESAPIHVIKSKNSEGILKLDKKTCVRDANVLRMANIGIHSRNMYQKCAVRKYYDELLYPATSYAQEEEINYIDHHHHTYEYF